MNPENENAREVIPERSQRCFGGSNARPNPTGKPENQDWEDKRNAAACFKNENKTEDWHADFLGLMVTEDLPAGTRLWVNVRKRLTRKGDVYVSVVLKRQKG
jgi:hypothetical protein